MKDRRPPAARRGHPAVRRDDRRLVAVLRHRPLHGRFAGAADRRQDGQRRSDRPRGEDSRPEQAVLGAVPDLLEATCCTGISATPTSRTARLVHPLAGHPGNGLARARRRRHLARHRRPDRRLRRVSGPVRRRHRRAGLAIFGMSIPVFWLAPDDVVLLRLRADPRQDPRPAHPADRARRCSRSPATSISARAHSNGRITSSCPGSRWRSASPPSTSAISAPSPPSSSGRTTRGPQRPRAPRRAGSSFRHVGRNIAPTMTVLLGADVATALSGVFFVETVFNIPGLGWTGRLRHPEPRLPRHHRRRDRVRHHRRHRQHDRRPPPRRPRPTRAPGGGPVVSRHARSVLTNTYRERKG